MGRAALLARLDELLIEDHADRWVVVTGGPGMGKSALLAAWLLRREAAGTAVPHHFIRRGEYDWDDPAKLVGSLVAQIEARFPDQREPDADSRMHPAARLGATLGRVSEHELVPRGDRLVILIDGLDEYDPPAGAPAGDPLAAFLPHTLPHGVSFVCASRPRHPYVSSLEARDGVLVRLDLDDPSSATDNDATVRRFWEQAAPPLGLDARFVDAAVASAGGNVQHAVTLQKHLAGQPAGQRRALDIPRGLAALLERSWERLATDPVVVCGLGILCAAREALTLDELGAVAGWIENAPRRVFLRGARELLIESPRSGGHTEYRLHHDSIRAYIASELGTAALRGHHAALARRLATWPAPLESTARRYALRHALIHRVEANEWADAWRLAADMSFLEAKCRELGAHEAESDVARAAERCRASGDDILGRRFEALVRALGRESHWLRAAPEATASLLWNRLRRSGWSADEIDQQLQIPAGLVSLRLRHLATCESAALVRELVGHSGAVTACAVTADDRRVVSASEDGTLRVWNLDNGRVLATLEGHQNVVSACAVTADGKRMVSASWDGTLKVWDLESACVLATLEGHAAGVSACAATLDGARVISASGDQTLKVWALESGRALATLEGHRAGVTACAVTPDGKRVVSASSDQMLKIWDLESGRELTALGGHAEGVTACAVTPDGQRVVSASGDRTLKIWDLESGCVLATLEGHTAGVRGCTLTRDGRRVISASMDRTLKVWDLESGRSLATLRGHAGVVSACAVTAGGRHVVSASFDKTLKVWDLESERGLAILEGHAGRVNACAVTVDGRRGVSASDDHTLKLWDPVSGRALATLQGHSERVNVCAVAPDGSRLVSGAFDRTVRVWDLDSGCALATLQVAGGDWVYACGITADGEYVASVSGHGHLQVWDLEGGSELDIVADSVHRARVAVTSDGRRVVSASWYERLVWDLGSKRVLALGGLRGGACAVAPDGQREISARDDGTLRVWDPRGGHELAVLAGHTGEVLACGVTSDGRCVVSASEDRTLKIWDLDTYACLYTHRGEAAFTAVAATATVIIAGDAAGAVWFLDWPGIACREVSDSRR